MSVFEEGREVRASKASEGHGREEGRMPSLTSTITVLVVADSRVPRSSNAAQRHQQDGRREHNPGTHCTPLAWPPAFAQPRGSASPWSATGKLLR